MPHKFNAARRHKFDKAQYRVINWAEYNESLRQRGDLTIETCLTLRTAYRLGLRQTQGLMGSIGTLMGLDIRVPDYSTLSRRCAMKDIGKLTYHRYAPLRGRDEYPTRPIYLGLILGRFMYEHLFPVDVPPCAFR